MLKLRRKQQGFTIVELLIVIVIIGILAAISVVAYNGVSKKANASAIESNLSQAARKLGVLKAEDGAFPADLSASGIADVASYDYYTSANRINYCLSSKKGDVVREISSSNTTPREGICAGAMFRMTLSGGISYDEAKDQLILSQGSTGNARIPPYYLEGKTTSMTLSLESYSTVPGASSPGGMTQIHTGSAYFALDKTTSVQNSIGWSSNGDAKNLPLNAWANYSWDIQTGSNVQYALFRIYATPERTSDNIIRNVRVTYK